MMQDGEIFTGYFGGEHNIPPTALKLLLFYAPGANGGALHWCKPNLKQIQPNCSLPLQDIKDIYLGKGSLQLYDTSIPDDECFSFVTHQNFYLNLQAPSAQHLSAWLYGINRIVLSAGRQLVRPKSSTPPFQQKPQAMHRAMAGFMPSDMADIETAKQGLRCSVFYGGYENVPFSVAEVQVFYLPDYGGPRQLGSISWCPTGRRQIIPGSQVALNDVKDIISGKRTIQLQSKLASGLDPAQCFTIVTANDQNLNLRALDAAELASWIASIEKLASANGIRLPSLHSRQTVELSTAPQNAADAKSQYQPNASASQATPGSRKRRRQKIRDISYCERIMRDGNVFQGFFGGSKQTPFMRIPIFVFYVPGTDGRSLGTVHWCQPGSREKLPGRQIRLKTVTDVYLGKRTKQLKSKLAASLPETHCFTIISSKGTQVNLAVADNDTGPMMTWLYGLKHLLTRDSIQLPSFRTFFEKQVYEYSPRLPPHPLAKGSTTPSSKLRRNQNGQSRLLTVDENDAGDLNKTFRGRLENGQKFTGIFDQDGTMVRKEVFIYFDLDQNTKQPIWREGDSEICIDIGSLKDIYVGKRTLNLKSTIAKDLHTEACFAMVFNNDSCLSVCAENREMMWVWLHDISRLAKENGKQFEDLNFLNTTPYQPPEQLPNSVDLLMDQLHQKNTTLTQLSSEETERMMQMGEIFTGFFCAEGGTIVAVDILFFLHLSSSARPDGSFPGAFCWCLPGKRQIRSECKIPLENVCDVFLGKRTDEFRSRHVAHTVEASCCFTLITSSRQHLNLFAPSQVSLAAWMFGINRVLARRNMELAKGARGEYEHLHKISKCFPPPRFFHQQYRSMPAPYMLDPTDELLEPLDTSDHEADAQETSKRISVELQRLTDVSIMRMISCDPCFPPPPASSSEESSVLQAHRRLVHSEFSPCGGTAMKYNSFHLETEQSDVAERIWNMLHNRQYTNLPILQLGAGLLDLCHSVATAANAKLIPVTSEFVTDKFESECDTAIIISGPKSNLDLAELLPGRKTKKILLHPRDCHMSKWRRDIAVMHADLGPEIIVGSVSEITSLVSSIVGQEEMKSFPRAAKIPPKDTTNNDDKYQFYIPGNIIRVGTISIKCSFQYKDGDSKDVKYDLDVSIPLSEHISVLKRRMDLEEHGTYALYTQLNQRYISQADLEHERGILVRWVMENSEDSERELIFRKIDYQTEARRIIILLRSFSVYTSEEVHSGVRNSKLSPEALAPVALQLRQLSDYLSHDEFVRSFVQDGGLPCLVALCQISSKALAGHILHLLTKFLGLNVGLKVFQRDQELIDQIFAVTFSASPILCNQALEWLHMVAELAEDGCRLIKAAACSAEVAARQSNQQKKNRNPFSQLVSLIASVSLPCKIASLKLINMILDKSIAAPTESLQSLIPSLRAAKAFLVVNNQKAIDNLELAEQISIFEGFTHQFVDKADFQDASLGKNISRESQKDLRQFQEAEEKADMLASVQDAVVVMVGSHSSYVTDGRKHISVLNGHSLSDTLSLKIPALLCFLGIMVDSCKGMVKHTKMLFDFQLL